MDKMRSTLKQFARDWSAEGKPERDATYKPIVAALDAHFKDVKKEDRKNLQVLTPGAGLGRLSWDICQEGFASQGAFGFYSVLCNLSHVLISKATSSPSSCCSRPSTS